MLKKLEKKFRLFFPKYLKTKNKYINAIKGLNGIEIGGPSFSFSKLGLLPIYPVINSLDGCNFSDNTLWETELHEGNTYQFSKNKKPGKQFIAEGNDLKQVQDNTYDFLLSCHNLEHFANPLKALHEWKRIVKPGGYLLLVLPHKEKTFDHNRQTTTLDHLIEDFKKQVEESDNTHFEEVIRDHDITMDEGIKSIEALKERTYKNFENRGVHHHVFDENLVPAMLMEAGYNIISMELMQINIFVLAKNIK